MNWRNPDYIVKGIVPQFEKSTHLLSCLQLGEKIEAAWLYFIINTEMTFHVALNPSYWYILLDYKYDLCFCLATLL